MALTQLGEAISGTMEQYYLVNQYGGVGHRSVSLSGSYVNGSITFTLADNGCCLTEGSIWTGTVNGNEMSGSHTKTHFSSPDPFAASRQ